MKNKLDFRVFELPHFIWTAMFSCCRPDTLLCIAHVQIGNFGSIASVHG
jgi:hypothetical protein